MKKEAVIAFARSPKTLMWAGYGLGVSGGALIGAGVTAYVLNKRFDEVLNTELDRQRDFLTAREKKNQFATVQEAAEELGVDIPEASEPEEEAPQTGTDADLDPERAQEDTYEQKVDYSTMYQPTEQPEQDEQERDIVRAQIQEAKEFNVFEDGFNPNDLPERNPDEPYVISKEEFFNSDYLQHELTYFRADDTLIDDKDNVIEDSDNVIGNLNLLRFGVLSNDPRLVYIRNETLECDFEISLSDGDYAHEVHGFRHSDDEPRVRRFRDHHDG